MEFVSYFQVESLKAYKNYQKDHSFYNTVSLKKPHSFYNPQLTKHCQKYSSPTQLKTLNFPASMFLVGVRKHICSALFLDVQKLNSRST